MRAYWVVFGVLCLVSHLLAGRPEPLDIGAEGAGRDAIIKTIKRGGQSSGDHIIIGDYLYSTNTGPVLEVYDLVSLKLVGVIPLEFPPHRLTPHGSTLGDRRSDSAKTLVEFDSEAQRPLDPYDVDAHERRLKDLPPQNRPVRRYDIVFNGRFYSAGSEGTVQEWDDGKLQTHTYDQMLGKGPFYHVVTGNTVVAFNHNGVCAVNTNLAPVRRLIRVEGHDEIMDVAGDGKTLAILTRSSLQIWRSDGSFCFRKEDIECTKYTSRPRRKLIPFAGGYLAAGKQLMWAHPDSSKAIWRYEPAGIDTALKEAVFAEPSVELSHRRIIMASEDGDLHIIDASQVLGRELAPPVAEGGPKPFLKRSEIRQ